MQHLAYGDFYIEKSVKSEIKATFSVPLYKNIFYI